jgi:hypothetical protein
MVPHPLAPCYVSRAPCPLAPCLFSCTTQRTAQTTAQHKHNMDYHSEQQSYEGTSAASTPKTRFLVRDTITNGKNFESCNVVPPTPPLYVPHSPGCRPGSIACYPCHG